MCRQEDATAWLVLSGVFVVLILFDNLVLHRHLPSLWRWFRSTRTSLWCFIAKLPSGGRLCTRSSGFVARWCSRSMCSIATVTGRCVIGPVATYWNECCRYNNYIAKKNIFCTLTCLFCTTSFLLRLSLLLQLGVRLGESLDAGMNVVGINIPANKIWFFTLLWPRIGVWLNQRLNAGMDVVGTDDIEQNKIHFLFSFLRLFYPFFSSAFFVRCRVVWVW